jgi:hypothetical protein
MVALVVWTTAMKPPNPLPEPESPQAAPVSAAPGPVRLSNLEAVFPSQTPLAAAAAPPVRQRPPSTPAAPPPTIPRAVTAAAPPAPVAPRPAEAAATPEVDSASRRLDGLRDTARRQFGRGENQQGLMTVANGLELAPGDLALRQMLDEALNQARDGAAQARASALAVAAAAADTSSYREADLRTRDAAHSAQNGAPVDAVRGYWLAAGLFARASNEALASSTSLPAAPTVAVRDPEPRSAAAAPTAAGAAVDDRSATPIAGAGAPSIARPSIPAVPTVPTDEPAIHSTLQSYAAAYSELDAGAVRRVFPAVNEQALRRAFGGLRSQQVAIEGEQVAVKGDRATVSCTLVTLAVGQVGVATPRRDSRRVTFTLARHDGTWIIVDRR